MLKNFDNRARRFVQLAFLSDKDRPWHLKSRLHDNRPSELGRGKIEKI
jgi:hypothetical protein